MFVSLTPFKQGKLVYSRQLDYPVISFYHINETVFTLGEALPGKILFFTFSGGQMIWWCLLAAFSWAVQWAGWSGSIEFLMWEHKKKGPGNHLSLGRFIRWGISQCWECFYGSFSNLGYVCGGSSHESQCELMKGSILRRVVSYWEAAGSFHEIPVGIFIKI